MKVPALLFLGIVSLCAGEDWLALAQRQQKAGDLAAALDSLSHAWQETVAREGADSLQAADIDLRFADLQFVRGDHIGAIERSRHALSVYQNRLGAENRKVAEALASIGSNYTGASDYSQGRPYLEQALALWQKLGQPEDETFGHMLNQYAFNLMRVGDYAAAKLTEERAIAILEKTGPAGLTTLGQGIRNMAHILDEFGDYSSANAANRRALAIIIATAGSESDAAGDLLVTMGNAARDSGDFAGGRDMHARAAAVYEKRLGPNNTRVAGALDNLGQDLLGLNQPQAAKQIFERALEIQKQALGPRSPWVGNLIQGLAKVAAAEGDYATARTLYEQNLDIWREQLGATHPFTVVSQTNLAAVLAHLGERQAALDLTLSTVRIRTDHLKATVQTVGERQALRYAGIKMSSLDIALTLVADPPHAGTKEAWDAVIRTRALVLDEMAARQRAIRQSKDPAIAGLAQDLANSRSSLARLAVQGKGSLTQIAYDSQMEAARLQVQKAAQSIAVRNASFRETLEREQAGFSQVSAALPAGSALIAYVRYSRSDFSRPGDHATPSYAAFCLRAGDSTPAMVNLGPAARIEEAVRTWRGEIERERKAAGHSQARNEASYRAAADSLRKLVWDPAGARLAHAGRVFIVPDGALQYVNFAALPTADGRYLVESGPLLHLLSAERDLAGERQAPSSSSRLLAIGDPAFRARESGDGPLLSRTVYRGEHSSCSDFAGTVFEPLPQSAVEVRTLAGIWKQTGGQAETLTGATATEAAVKRDAPGARVLHLATHGFFLDSCEGEQVALENPLLRSGLALAGANHRNAAHGDQEDGILTAEEASSLDLSAAEWVVLSGCETGLGEIKAGEGVLGLRRAFQEAGARSVITSLWAVDDAEAQQWMVQLYRNRFTRGAGTAEAVRDADRKMIGTLRAAGQSTHPFHWASFVAVGDWR
jgi:CHAT domain-containing protein